MTWGFNPGCQAPLNPHAVLHCVSISLILLICTLCLDEKAMQREIEHECRGWGGGCEGPKKVIQISANGRVSDPLSPICVLPHHYSSLAFLFSELFLIPPLLGDGEDGWGDCLFTGNQAIGPPTCLLLITGRRSLLPPHSRQMMGLGFSFPGFLSEGCLIEWPPSRCLIGAEACRGWGTRGACLRKTSQDR